MPLGRFCFLLCVWRSKLSKIVSFNCLQSVRLSQIEPFSGGVARKRGKHMKTLLRSVIINRPDRIPVHPCTLFILFILEYFHRFRNVFVPTFEEFSKSDRICETKTFSWLTFVSVWYCRDDNQWLLPVWFVVAQVIATLWRWAASMNEPFKDQPDVSLINRQKVNEQTANASKQKLIRIRDK